MTPSAYAGDLGGLVGVGHAEPDPDRQVSDRTDPGHQPGRGRGGLLPGPGHAHHRGRVDEPAAQRGDPRHPLVRGGRRDQEDRVKRLLVRGRQPGAGLLRGQVRGDHPGAAGGGEVGGEPVDAVLLDRGSSTS